LRTVERGGGGVDDASGEEEAMEGRNVAVNVSDGDDALVFGEGGPIVVLSDAKRR
jgi:hypothetical protein